MLNKAKQFFTIWYRFLILLVFLALSVWLLQHTKVTSPKEHYDHMLEAAERAAACFSAIKDEKLARGLTIDPVADPNETGMIGDQFTDITTTHGMLEAKRSSTNPNVAAMICDMLLSCGVKKDSLVAVNLSSSFPALNIAVECALDTIGAKGIIANSIGSSTYGANIPEFTYLDMEQLLLEKGLISNHASIYSEGGANDIASDLLFPEAMSSILERVSGYGLTYIHEEDLTENLDKRMNLYEAAAGDLSSIVCFINAGGNLVGFGGDAMGDAASGILDPSTEISGDGLAQRFLSQDTPVIHLLDMKNLLPEYGLPFDPVPLPEAGQGTVYTQTAVNKPLAVVLVIISLLLFVNAAKHFPRRRFPL